MRFTATVIGTGNEIPVEGHRAPADMIVISEFGTEAIMAFERRKVTMLWDGRERVQNTEYAMISYQFFSRRAS